jgi:hypothetical protein
VVGLRHVKSWSKPRMLRTFGSEIGLGFSKLKKKEKIEQMFI